MVFLETNVVVISPKLSPPNIKDSSGNLAKWTLSDNKKYMITTIRLSHLGIYSRYREFNKLGLLNHEGHPFVVKHTDDPYNAVLDCVVM